MPVLSVRHLTRYRYRKPVVFGEHRMMFRPREGCDQRLLAFKLVVTPVTAQIRHIQDVLGNWVDIAKFTGRSTELSFEARFTLEHSPLVSFTDAYTDAGDFPDLLQAIQLLHSDPDGQIAKWARRFVRPIGETSLQHLLSDVIHAIHAEFTYSKRLESGLQTPVQTLESRRGTCRDFAVMMMEAVRTLGLASQFVSGYVHSPEGAGSGNLGGDGHTHALVRVYLPQCGWGEFDPTNGIVGNTDLIRVAVARDPRQAMPLHGAWIGFPTDYLGMDVEVDVTEFGAEAALAAFG
jgi:transglutaminase-like putative cysteine protease